MRFTTLTGAVLLAVLTFMTGNAEARIPHPKGCHSHACDVRVWHKFQVKTIRPYVRSFLGPTGACESGTDTNLRHGLRVVSPSGQYRGRYQFGWPDWYGAGGTGDPAQADWLDQSYYAVRWLHINGRDSWPNC
jgi:hypothetical protein